ncbi:MAG: hypothetical protein AAGD07_13180 [Planctomycetota bacterium]
MPRKNPSSPDSTAVRPDGLVATCLLNPNGILDAKVTATLRAARKTMPLWAREITETSEVQTLEGRVVAESGDYLCRGIHGEQWPQKADKLLQKYIASGEVDVDGYRRFDPKPNARPVEVAQIPHSFQIRAQWGVLSGKAHDYVVRSMADPSDIWVVDRSIFETSYTIQAAEQQE